MRASARWWSLLGAAIAVASPARPVRAAEGPLLVVVEAPPALDADAAEIRRAIGAELRVETVAPMKTATDPPERALIVAIDRERIAMSLRTSDAGPVVRSIPTPADRVARLRAIAWLAGNLARDQVSPILAEPPPEPPPVATRPPPLAATEPPPAPATSSTAEAPPPPSPEPRVPPTATIATRAEPPRPAGPLRWSVSGSIGPLLATFNYAPLLYTFDGTPVSQRLTFGPQLRTAWQVSVQRRREGERLIIGGTLQGVYEHSGVELLGPGQPLLGADIFVGAQWHFRRCTLETTVGAGPQAQSVIYGVGVYDAGPGPSITSYRLALYARGTVAAAIPISGSLQGLVQVGINVNASQDGFWFLASTFGLRYAFP